MSACGCFFGLNKIKVIGWHVRFLPLARKQRFVTPCARTIWECSQIRTGCQVSFVFTSWRHNVHYNHNYHYNYCDQKWHPNVGWTCVRCRTCILWARVPHGYSNSVASQRGTHTYTRTHSYIWTLHAHATHPAIVSALCWHCYHRVNTVALKTTLLCAPKKNYKLCAVWTAVYMFFLYNKMKKK